MEDDREQAARAILPADGQGQETTGGGVVTLGRDGSSDRSRNEGGDAMKFWRRNREERELDEELRFHLAQEEQLRRDRGQDPAGARREFGNLALVRENTRATWGWSALERTARDLRFALRLLRKS